MVRHHWHSLSVVSIALFIIHWSKPNKFHSYSDMDRDEDDDDDVNDQQQEIGDEEVQEYEEEDGMDMDLDDMPVTQEDAWAVIR